MATLGLAFLPARRRSAWRKASSARFVDRGSVETNVPAQLWRQPILNAGGVNHRRQQQSQGIDGNVAFVPFDFLAGIETALPPFNVV